MNALAQCHPDVNAPLFKRVSSDRGEHLLVVPHSRIYDLPPDLAARFDAGDSEAIISPRRSRRPPRVRIRLKKYPSRSRKAYP